MGSGGNHRNLRQIVLFHSMPHTWESNVKLVTIAAIAALTATPVMAQTIQDEQSRADYHQAKADAARAQVQKDDAQAQASSAAADAASSQAQADASAAQADQARADRNAALDHAAQARSTIENQ
jgi:hypothetical protein